MIAHNPPSRVFPAIFITVSFERDGVEYLVEIDTEIAGLRKNNNVAAFIIDSAIDKFLGFTIATKQPMKNGILMTHPHHADKIKVKFWDREDFYHHHAGVIQEIDDGIKSIKGIKVKS